MRKNIIPKIHMKIKVHYQCQMHVYPQVYLRQSILHIYYDYMKTGLSTYKSKGKANQEPIFQRDREDRESVGRTKLQYKVHWYHNRLANVKLIWIYDIITNWGRSKNQTGCINLVRDRKFHCFNKGWIMVGEKGKTNHTDGCPAKDEMDFVVRWHIGFFKSPSHIFHDFKKQGAKERKGGRGT